MLKDKLQKRLIEAKRFYSTDKFRTTLSLAGLHFEQGRLSSCKECLDKLPTKDVLFESLVSKLKGKSIYKTLKKIHEKDDVDPLTKVKGLSSLTTHAIIEMQQGSPEYGILLPILQEREEELISELSLGTSMSAKRLAKKVNKILKHMSMLSFNEGELVAYIDALSENARNALEEALKEKELTKIFNILGMKEVTTFTTKVKGQE